MRRESLNGMWTLKGGPGAWEVSVSVPGSVIAGLYENKKIEDPYYRRNEYEIRELFREDYEFGRSFVLPEELWQEEQLDLVCKGLDTLADVYVNGTLVLQADNMHRTWRVPVREVLHAGENEIRIVFRSVLNYIDAYEYAENREVKYTSCGAMYGSHLLRKPHSMFGWDWGPQLPDAGIFRDIYLEGHTGARLEDVMLTQEHGEQVKLHVRAEVKGELPEGGSVLGRVWEACDGKSEADGKDTCAEGICRDASACVQNMESAERKLEAAAKKKSWEAELAIQDPKLWWPNGYGAQKLYHVEVLLLDAEGRVVDSWKRRIGLRTLTVSRQKDQWGEEFAFIVNGVKIFAMGGDYIPEDAVYPWITRQRQEYLLESCRRANFNCIRVWGGGYYPSDAFYDMCDEKGLIVWQDLMYACNVYEVTDSFAENCRLEAVENVKRLRHHASLGLWCGNNEIESAWVEWKDFQKESMYLRADYIRLFEEILPKAVRETDPQTFYWPSSPSSGGCMDDPGDENRGDTHYWDVWHGQKPFTDYQNYYFRFCSEFGFQSYPGIKTVRSFTEPADRNVFSRVMESHQKNDAANGKMLYYLSENFRYPDTFPHLLYVSQILQGMAIKSGVDHWRRNRGRCMGAVYWQLNDNWPVASWASIDYYGRWKALHYMAKRFFAPQAVSLVRKGSRVTAWLENEAMEAVDYEVKLVIRDCGCQVRKCVRVSGSVDAMSSCEAAVMDFGELAGEEEKLFAEVQAVLASGECLSDLEPLLPYKYMELPKGRIRAEVTEIEEAYEISLTADCVMPFVELDFEDADAIFGDNYFHMTQERPYRILLRKCDVFRGSFQGAEDVAKRLRICSLADTYE